VTVKVLYVCPFAHYSGHHPHVALIEPPEMNADLVTCCGIINGTKPTVKHYQTLPNWKLFQVLRKRSLTRWPFMMFETAATIDEAIHLYKKHEYNIMYIRDGEPFLFMSFLLLWFTPYKNMNIVISLTGAVINSPKFNIKNPLTAIYVLGIKCIKSRMWNWLYIAACRMNNFHLVTQNEETKKKYKGSIFEDKISCIEWGIDR
jgi:hypothetical protein